MARVIEMIPMLPVSDIAASTDFYVGRLGFEVETRMEHLALLRLGGIGLYLVTDSEPTPDKPGVSILRRTEPTVTPVNLTFRVDDARAVHAELEERGVTFLVPPEDKPWGETRCFTRDPDGYLIEFYEPH